MAEIVLPGTPGAGGPTASSPLTGVTINTGQKQTVMVPAVKPALAKDIGAPLGSGRTEMWQFVPAAQLANLPQLMWDQGDLKGSLELMKLVKAAGYSSWEDALAGAANDPMRAQRGYMDFLRERAEQAKALGLDLDGSGGGGGGDGPFSYTTTTATVFDESNAAALADQVWQQELGRMATDDEIRAFQKALNVYQRSQPATSSVTGVQSGNNRTQNQVNETGFDPTRFATEYARSRPDYAEHYAGVQFMDLLDKAISEPNALDDLIAGGS